MEQKISTAFHLFFKLLYMEPNGWEFFPTDLKIFYQCLTTLLIGPKNLNRFLSKFTPLFIRSKNSQPSFINVLLSDQKISTIFINVLQPILSDQKILPFFSISFNPTYGNEKYQQLFISFLNSSLWKQEISLVFINLVQHYLLDQ